MAFTCYRVDEAKTEYKKDDTKIDLGAMRLLLQGYVSAWAGANISVAASIDIACPRGNMEMRSICGAEAEAIIGVKAEAGIKADLEWKNPKDEKPKFNMLGSVGYTVTGIAGASAAAEFKIGFDDASKRFQVKMKAQAAWGLGVGGSFSFTVGLNYIFSFIDLVHQQLFKEDFCFVDMFETVDDESRTDVYSLFCAMCAKTLSIVNPVLGATAYVVSNKKTYKALATLHDKSMELVDEWKRKSQKEDKLDEMAENILNGGNFIKRLTPETKGRILYYLCSEAEKSSFMDRAADAIIDTIKEGDINGLYENAAQKLIIDGIATKRDWQETLEHMATEDLKWVYVSKGDKKTRDGISQKEADDKINRVQKNEQWIKNHLYAREYSKWKTIKEHTQQLK